MKAVFLDFGTVGYDERLDLDPLRELTPELGLFDHTSDEEIAGRIAGCEIVFVNKVRLTRDIIAQADALSFIGIFATGVDNVDLDAARERGVAVCNVRDYCTNSLVEHVFAVLLALTHSTLRYAASVRDGDWRQAANFCMLQYPIRELAAMTIGIVGHGSLGSGVAKVARAFGMNVMIARRRGQAGDKDGRADFGDVLRRCDVLSLHCPLTPETEGLIGARELALMKPSAILVNTARGRLVDSAALADALANGGIGGAAIDVLTREPPVGGDPLLDYRGDNLIVTPHVAWATFSARQNAIDQLAATLRSFLEGGDLNRVA